MRLLLDTHLLLWAKGEPERITDTARQLIDDAATEAWFSVVSLWEIVIKRARQRSDFVIEARDLRRKLLDDGFRELVVTSEHAFAVAHLPPIHKDPFDRLLVAQATVEAFTLLTTDRQLARYRGPVQLA